MLSFGVLGLVATASFSSASPLQRRAAQAVTVPLTRVLSGQVSTLDIIARDLARLEARSEGTFGASASNITERDLLERQVAVKNE